MKKKIVLSVLVILCITFIGYCVFLINATFKATAIRSNSAGDEAVTRLEIKDRLLDYSMGEHSDIMDSINPGNTDGRVEVDVNLTQKSYTKHSINSYLRLQKIVTDINKIKSKNKVKGDIAVDFYYDSERFATARRTTGMVRYVASDDDNDQNYDN